jgi:hypothetical protein
MNAMSFRLSVAIAAAAIVLAGDMAHGQQPNAPAAANDANAIAQALRDVDVKMTHPDPDMRIGYLETIVAEGNARKIERAVRIALAGQDENLRALGFRAYLAATGSVVFEILVTPQERKQVEDSRSDRRHSLPRYLENSSRVNYSVKLEFEPAQINSMRGFVRAGSRQALEYTMRGERLTFGGLSNFGGANAQCNWELKPTKDLKILASLACQSWERPMQLTAAMF